MGTSSIRLDAYLFPAQATATTMSETRGKVTGSKDR